MARFRMLWSFAGVLVALAAVHGADTSPGILVDREKRTITVDCKVAPRKMDDPKFQGVIYPIEVIACYPYPRGQKAHETVVTIDVKPSAIHKALESLGLKPGKSVTGDTEPQGPAVNLFIEVSEPGGKARRVSIEKTLIDPKTNKLMPKVEWRFTGSVLTKPDPSKDDMVYGADLTGTLISIFPVTDQTVFQTNLTMKQEKFLKLETNTKVLPPIGTPVKLVIEVPAGK